jgi:FAD/FMN-containing dehydrogenase
MFANNISIVAPRDGTIGVYGGWTAGGGHNVLASTYGLGADQVLSLQAVTADGRFVTADKNQNQDLFYAMRGGGGCKCHF